MKRQLLKNVIKKNTSPTRVELNHINPQGIGTQNGYQKLNYIKEELLQTGVHGGK